jgi:hypothetical protein
MSSRLAQAAVRAAQTPRAFALSRICSLAALAALFAIQLGSPAHAINISASSSGYGLFVDVNALNGTMRSTRPIAGDDEPPRHFFRFAAGGTLFFDHWDPAIACECSRLFADLKSAHAKPLAAANPFAIDVAVTIAVDVRWTDGDDDECLMVHVPLPRLKEYVAYLATAAVADLLAAN